MQSDLLQPQSIDTAPLEAQPQHADKHQDESISTDSIDESQSNVRELQATIHEGYNILGSKTNSDNQTLMLTFRPGDAVWHKGAILFSSAPLKPKREEQDGLGFLAAVLDKLQKGYTEPQLYQNEGETMSYCVLKKEHPRDGKILALSKSVYKQNFYIDMRHLLVINCSKQEYDLVAHPLIRTLHLFDLRDTAANSSLFICLQSSRDKCIIEKYLAEEESIRLENATVLAMSQDIRCELKDGQTCLAGPGFVFFEPSTRVPPARVLLDVVLVVLLTLLAVELGLDLLLM